MMMMMQQQQMHQLQMQAALGNEEHPMHARENTACLNPPEMRRILTEQASQARERSLHFGEDLEEEKLARCSCEH